MQQGLDYVTLGIGMVGGLVVVYGVLVGAVDLVRSEWDGIRRRGERHITFERIRYDIGSHLLLGLEFLIAADVIRTVTRPTLEELAVLGGIVAIRTVLSYFLGREISRHNSDSLP